MPNVGYCHDCGEWVYVLADWSCPKGHPAARVNGWCNSDSGKPIAPRTPDADVPRDVREEFICDLNATIAQYPAYTAVRGQDTDISIVSNPVDPTWASGMLRSEYDAAVKVVEPQRAVYFWEALKQRGIETSAGTSMEWGYGTTRRLVEAVALRHGLMLKTVLRKSSALW
jgi:hypothetical protein